MTWLSQIRSDLILHVLCRFRSDLILHSAIARICKVHRNTLARFLVAGHCVIP